MDLNLGLIKKHLAIETTNTAASLTAEQLKDSDENKAVGAIITVENTDVRLTLDGSTAPSQGPAGIGLLFTHGDQLRITRAVNLANMAWISAEVDTPARLQIALEFMK